MKKGNDFMKEIAIRNLSENDIDKYKIALIELMKITLSENIIRKNYLKAM